MKISVFGLGYVGAITAGCLAKEGHDVIGADVDLNKVNLINQGKSPVIEKEIDVIIENALNEGKLCATNNVTDAINQSDLSIICVGTPSRPNGSLDLAYVQRVCEQIGETLANKDSFHIVVMRSTMLPGSMNEVVIPALESSSGKKAGKDFGICINPEFLRESTAVYDFYHPPKTVIGTVDEHSANVLASLYQDFDAPLIKTDLATAEMVKYTDNVSHAMKVCFANEIGNLCKKLGIDGHEVMDIWCQDTKLNLSSYYLKPGFAFGGSCLPKDVRALNYKARSMDLNLPLISSLMKSNFYQIDNAMKLITNSGSKKVGILGLSFKAGTDDLRESPIVALIEKLIGKGYELKVYDRNVQLASLSGANKDYIHTTIPHIYSLMVNDMNELLDHSDVIVVGNNDPEFQRIADQQNNFDKVLDLVRMDNQHRFNGNYEGICW